ncbi:MAG: hypothetical protein WDN48_07975 [Pseudolabrys sp.]
MDGPPARLDSAPQQPLYSPPAQERPTPYERPAAPAPVEAPVASAAPQEPPRRRSTIREPAPIGATGATPAPVPAIPVPTPVVSSTAEPAAPKRGWWGKRLLGDK